MMIKTGMLTSAMALAIALTGVSTTDAEARRGHGPKVDFSQLDANSDGQLTAAELQAYGDARFAALDTNGDGGVSLEEMMARLPDDAPERASARIEKRFSRADANDDGKITTDERRTRDHARMIERLDTDGNGTVSEAEFADASKARKGRKDRRKPAE